MKKHLILLSLIFISIACADHKTDLIIINSEFTPGPDSILVFTPEAIKSEKSYPLVILLHGWSGNYLQWNEIANLQEYADAYNFIIACPDGFYNSWYINNPLKPDMQFDDFFWKEFIPYLTKTYSIETSNIFITGLSMGGHGAISLFLKKPQFFRSAGSSSGILDLTFFPEKWEIKDGIGTIQEYPERWKKYSAIYLLDSLRDFNKNMIIDCGTEDFAYYANLNFVKKCYDLGVNVKFISVPGNHTRDHWKKMIAKHFEFFYKQLSN